MICYSLALNALVTLEHSRAALTGRRFLTPLSIRKSLSHFTNPPPPPSRTPPASPNAASTQRDSPAAKRLKRARASPSASPQQDATGDGDCGPSKGVQTDADGLRENGTAAEMAADAAAAEHLVAIFKVAAPGRLSTQEVLAVAGKASEALADGVLAALGGYLRPFFETAPRAEVRLVGKSPVQVGPVMRGTRAVTVTLLAG